MKREAMVRDFFYAVLGLMAALAPAAAQDAAPIKPPLSHYGALSAPLLHINGLHAATRQAVKAAIAVAAEASAKAAEAETILAAAEDAARKADATHIISFHGKPCRTRATGALGVALCADEEFIGQFRDGKPDGLGADYKFKDADAYEGQYRDGERAGLGIERDKDGFYPGRYGITRDKQNKPIVLELLGTQDFANAHWAGTYGFYDGPKIACTLIKGAVLEGSVLDGYGAKFDAKGGVSEQGRYRLGILENGAGPPC